MGEFTCHLELMLYDAKDGRPMLRDGRAQWFVRQPLSFASETVGATIVVPPWDGTPPDSLEFLGGLAAGHIFLTDLASIPWGVRSLFPPDGPWAKGAVIHDYLYATRGLEDVAGHSRVFTRKEADDILKEAMADLGVAAWQRNAIWAAVRTGGGGGWGH